jgi:manganese transport protein
MTAEVAGPPVALLPGAALPEPAVGSRAGRRSLLPAASAGTLGPALLVAAGYVDPGNWGTDVAAGAQFGYRLVWVLALATGLAVFLQYLAVRLGLASGQDLASLLRAHLPRPLRWVLIPPLLAVLAVTEVVEVLGLVIGVQLLTGWSALPAVTAATALVLVMLVAPPRTARPVVYGCLALVGVVYLAVLCRHGVTGVAGGLRPGPLPPGGLAVAAGLIGAVVMPHNILLHSALARDLRGALPDDGQHGPALARAARRSLLTTGAALGVAFAVNCAIMSVTVGSPGGGGDLAGALGAAAPMFGALTSMLFAVTLIGAGLASSVTGGMVSADVIGRVLPRCPGSPATRRVACLVPAAAVALSGLPMVSVLVWSQVLLTVALPLVLAPLIWFSSQRRIVGGWVLRPLGRVAAVLVTGGVFVAGLASLI